MSLLCCSFFNVHNELQVAFQPASTSGSNSGNIVYLIDPHEPVDQVGKEIGIRRPRTTYGSINSMDYARAGDRLSFGNPMTSCQKSAQGCKFGNFTSISGGASTIVSIRRTTDAAVLTQAAAVYKAFCASQPCAGSPSSFVYEAELASAVKIPKSGCLANDDDMSAAGSVIEDSVFQHSNANLGRTKSRGSVIRNNRFANAAECHLDAVPLPMYLEGPWDIPDVLISGNTFHGCPAKDTIHAGAMAHVTTVNNTFLATSQ